MFVILRYLNPYKVTLVIKDKSSSSFLDSPTGITFNEVRFKLFLLKLSSGLMSVSFPGKQSTPPKVK